MYNVLSKIYNKLHCAFSKDGKELKKIHNEHYATKAFSQEGEDLILNRIFEHTTKGFYVDVGAHHPQRFSNTYLFYKKGWNGINLDATPGSMNYFNIFRKRDVNLEIPISGSGDTLTYYMFNEPALNTFSEEVAKQYSSPGSPYTIVSKKDLETKTLRDILDRYLPEGQEIHFLSIDAEGLDLDILKSNNWNKYKPKIVLVEDHSARLEDITNNEIYNFMSNSGYLIYSKTVLTVVYISRDFYFEFCLKNNLDPGPLFQ